MPQPVAVVTGASSGIGAAVVRRLAREGWRCVLVARREERLRTLAEEIGGEYEVCDVGDREAVERMAATVRDRHPRISLLVNNAGLGGGRRDFLQAEPERIELLVRTNYLGGVWCLRAFLPALEAAGGADVVNVVSVAGHIAAPPAGPYSASKYAQLAFSRSTTPILRRRGIRVHTVSPGFVETEGFSPRPTALQSGILRRLVIGPERVADHVLAAIQDNRRETFVPGFYRLVALLQTVFPTLVPHVVALRADYDRERA